MSIIEERLPWLETFVLDKGARSPDGKAYIMEAAAYVAGEEWSDHPECVSPAHGDALIDTLFEADSCISHMLYRGSWPGEKADVQRTIGKLRDMAGLP